MTDQPPAETPLPCIVCTKELEPAFGQKTGTGSHVPHPGLIFRAAGNYGSTLYDPVPVINEVLEINICDACVEAASRAGFVAKVTTTTVHTTHREPWETDMEIE